MGAGGFCRRLNLFVGGIEPPIAKVVGDTAGEKVGVLLHQPDLFAQACQCHIVDIVAVNRHFATGDIVEARYQANQGGFSCAGLADKGDGLSRFDGEVDVAQYKVGFCVVSVIGKVDVIEDNAPDYRW